MAFLPPVVHLVVHGHGRGRFPHQLLNVMALERAHPYSFHNPSCSDEDREGERLESERFRDGSVMSR